MTDHAERTHRVPYQGTEIVVTFPGIEVRKQEKIANYRHVEPHNSKKKKLNQCHTHTPPPTS